MVINCRTCRHWKTGLPRKALGSLLCHCLRTAGGQALGQASARCMRSSYFTQQTGVRIPLVSSSRERTRIPIQVGIYREKYEALSRAQQSAGPNADTVLRVLYRTFVSPRTNHRYMRTALTMRFISSRFGVRCLSFPINISS